MGEGGGGASPLFLSLWYSTRRQAPFHAPYKYKYAILSLSPSVASKTQSVSLSHLLSLPHKTFKARETLYV